MQLSPEEELEVRSCLERKKELKKKEKELKEKEEKINWCKKPQKLGMPPSVRNIPKFKDRASWSRDTFQPMTRRACVYQQTNQNIAPVLKNFQNNGWSRRTELKMSLQCLSRFHI